MRGSATTSGLRPRARLGTAVALLVLLCLAAGARPIASTAMEVGDPARPGPAPRVSDPVPPPGAVLPVGSHLIAARVRGAASADIGFLVDGARADGPPVDPDGQLSERGGIEVTLAAGRHVIGVAGADHGMLSEWEVLVAGIDIAEAGADPAAVGVRMSGRRAVPRAVVLVNPEHAETSAAAVTLAALTDALLLPTNVEDLPELTLRAIAEAKVDPVLGVVLAGGPQLISEGVAAQLTAAGHPVSRLLGAGAAELSASALAWLDALPLAVRPASRTGMVVAAAEPFAAAIAGATTAASLGARLLLVDPEGPTPAAVAMLQKAAPILLSTELSDLARVRVVGAVGAGGPISDDPMIPRRAADVVVVADGASDGLALLAARGAGPNRAVLIGSAAARSWVATNRPEHATLVGDPAEDGPVDDLAAVLPLDWVDGPDAPVVEVLVDDTAGLQVTFTAQEPLAGAAVHVDLLGFAWPGTVEVIGSSAVWRGSPRPRLPEALEPVDPQTPAQIDVTAVLSTTDRERHVRSQATARIEPLVSRSRDGFLVAGGASRVVGIGPLRTFSVEVEAQTGLDLQAVTGEVERILLDPRGWTADGSRSLQRIGSSRAADLRVVVAVPSTVDRLCGAAGLTTGGRVSCWDGYRAMLNLDRWTTGVVPFHTDLPVYREYLVNHEFGHGLGFGHDFCPGRGSIAPVMMQQTGGLGACVANGWPFPGFGTAPAIPRSG